jgi:hypothetical protein
MRTIVIESVRDYPLWQLEAAASAVTRQLSCNEGDGRH